MESQSPLTLGHCFRDLPDPRRSPSCQYDFHDILIIAICAAVAGQFAWTDIEDFGDIHQDWFQSFLRVCSERNP